ncbi:hypothetical protein MLD38_028974 [Melastoma candidum]|uniref:Uncharacterized protein n=1 Tax=Melastoma candidum TaxID=119954 RepID=A0ACB9N4W1_9MYRT|nr:hypothetical protein MLD38_028974 [Melastoma candidum]
MDSVTPMHNLFRASQLRFPGETILETASHYTSKFLTGKREANDWLDKWVIAEGLPSELGYALDIPFYASLPRLETRTCLDGLQQRPSSAFVQMGSNSKVVFGLETR